MSVTLYPCSVEQPWLKQPIVLLNGWNMNDSLWQTLIPTLQNITDVMVMRIAQYTALDTLCDYIVSQLPPRSILCGWSLGGMLAVRIAARFPARIEALITLATNVQFVADSTWRDAMPQDTFLAFQHSFQENPQKTRQRFLSLVTQGDSHAREQKAYLQSLDESAPHNAQLGLALLQEINNQSLMPLISCPSLHIHGEHDVLVPVVAAERIRVLAPQHQYHTMAGASHLLHCPTGRLEPWLDDFLRALSS